MALSNIQWCDYTFNPWIGCRFAVRSDGSHIEECFHCYAKTLDDNRYSRTLAPGTKENPVSHWGSGPRHRTKTWGDPLRWNQKMATLTCEKCGLEWAPLAWSSWSEKRAESDRCNANGGKCGGKLFARRARVFCASLADWLDDENVPIEWFVDLLKVIHETPNLDWLLLTKRPQNWETRLRHAAVYLQGRGGHVSDAVWQMVHEWLPWNGLISNTPPANVWIGVSAGADQVAALNIPARIHFLSCEPMLRPLDTTNAAQFKWIIFGGESGSKARPCNIDWIVEGIRFCRENAVAPFVKQFGSRPKYTAAGIEFTSTDGRDNVRKHMADSGWMIDWNSPHNDAPKITDSHGADMKEWPTGLRIREFPTNQPHESNHSASN
jgi:protein gp37